MARGDGRIEPGQRLTSAISARAWNRAQEAADLVLGRLPAIQGGPVNVPGLPAVKVRLPQVGYFGEVRVAHMSGGSGEFLEASVPGSATSIQEMSADEKKIFSFITVPTASAGQSTADHGPHSHLFICAGNNDNLYTIAGFAITRVRVTSDYHEYARPPLENVANTERVGTLDSVFWGPAKIVGYFQTDGTLRRNTSSEDTILFGQHRWRWALVVI